MKSDILSPSQLEQIETAMRNGTATQGDGVRLCNAYRTLWDEFKRLQLEGLVEIGWDLDKARDAVYG